MRSGLTALGFLIAASAFAQGPADSDFTADETLLKSQNLPTKGPELLTILRERTPSAAVIAEFKKHVARMRSDVYPVRKKATSDLIKMGAVVRPLLENLLLESNAELETVRRLRHVLEYFPAEKDFQTMSAAARLIRRDKPADSLKVLIEFVPYATNEYVRQDVQQAIDVVAADNKKQLVATLENENPARRAAAAEALVRKYGADVKTEIEPLLKDAHPLVRYQLGMALVEARDKAGLPLLISTLTDAPSERIEFALDLLYRAAGDDAPPDYYQGKATAAKFAAKWQAWLDKHGAKLDLPKQMTRDEIGFTVIATAAIGVKGRNKVFEIGPDKSVRWEFEGPRNPRDVQILGPNRLLLAEYTDKRVTERDFKGNILWQAAVGTYPVACQRLSNGHTFIATRQQLLIVDRDGKSVFTHLGQGVNGSIVTATRLRNGQFAVVTSGARCQLLDAEGRELKSIALGGNVYPIGGSVEVLRNGNVLVPLYTNNRVVEFDWNGTQIWSANLTGQPLAAIRLANGNTLVTCLNSRIVELNPAGQEVWSYQTEGRPFRARKR